MCNVFADRIIIAAEGTFLNGEFHLKIREDIYLPAPGSFFPRGTPRYKELQTLCCRGAEFLKEYFLSAFSVIDLRKLKYLSCDHLRGITETPAEEPDA